VAPLLVNIEEWWIRVPISLSTMATLSLTLKTWSTH